MVSEVRTLRRHLQKIPRCRGARGEKQTKLTANGGGRDAKGRLFVLILRGAVFVPRICCIVFAGGVSRVVQSLAIT